MRRIVAKTDDVELTSKWHEGYKRQAEIYQWLLKNNGFKVNPTVYFFYCNGDASKPLFNNRLEFRVQLLPHVGNSDWVEPMIIELHKCLQLDSLPAASTDCDYCKYRDAVNQIEVSLARK